MTTPNTTPEFAFDYTRGCDDAPAKTETGFFARIMVLMDKIAEQRAQAAIARLERVDPTLASRIREARAGSDQNG